MTLFAKALTGLNDSWLHQLQCNVNISLFCVSRTFYILHLHESSGMETHALISSHFIVLFAVSLLKWIVSEPMNEMLGWLSG